MADGEPVITALERIDTGNRVSNGEVARFSCLTGGVLIMGLRLRRLDDGSLGLTSAAVKGGSSRPAVGAVIKDGRLAAAVLSAATIVLDATPCPRATRSNDRRRRGRRQT